MPLKHIKQLEEKYLLQTYSRYDILIERGSGAYLIDRNNKRYLDLLAGIGVNALGYNHPGIIRLLRKQIKRPIHVSNLLYHEHQGLLAKKLVEISGLDRAFFTNSGAESVEGCIKFARVFANASGPTKPRTKVLAVEGAFHGRTLGALSATYEPRYRTPFEPLVPGFEFVKFNDPDDLEQKFSDEVAAVILETIQGEGGVRPISEEFYNRARKLTRDAGAALITDEVQCGLGRTGRWFAFHKFAPPDGPPEALPDLIAIAKPLGGGVPMGSVLLKEEVAKTIEVGTHGTTFGGGPLACRLSLLLDQVQEVGAYFRQRLEELTELPVVSEVRGDGLMLAVELTVPAKPIVQQLIDAGFITNATRQTVLRLLPPLILRKKQVDKFLVALRVVLEGAAS
jgi:acetylornithine/N-succinyldiaminopimelate aminotransferase